MGHASCEPLTIWVVQPGEPLPLDQEDVRLMRSGILAETLSGRGHRVTWWASAFRHASHSFRYKQQSFVDWNGITLALVHSPGYLRNISLRRIWDHHVLGRNLGAALEKSPAPDVIHCGYPPLETCEAVVDYGIRHGVPTVIDVRDMWPEAFQDVIPGWARPIVHSALAHFDRRAKRMLQGATAIHAHTPRFLEYGVGKAGRAAGPRDRSFPFAYRADPPKDAVRRRAEEFWDSRGIRQGEDILTVCFFGNMNTERPDVDYRTVALAVRLATQWGSQVRVVFCGAGRAADALRQEFGELPEHIKVPGYVTAAQIWVLMQRSSCGLLPYPPTSDFVDSFPNKAIEYLSGGLPVLTSLTTGYLFDRLSQARCIMPYSAGDPAALARILVGLARDEGARTSLSAGARALFDREFRAEHVYGELAASLEDLARASRRQATYQSKGEGDA